MPRLRTILSLAGGAGLGAAGRISGLLLVTLALAVLAEALVLCRSLAWYSALPGQRQRSIFKLIDMVLGHLADGGHQRRHEPGGPP